MFRQENWLVHFSILCLHNIILPCQQIAIGADTFKGTKSSTWN
jgi:hypothetical protein